MYKIKPTANFLGNHVLTIGQNLVYEFSFPIFIRDIYSSIYFFGRKVFNVCCKSKLWAWKKYIQTKNNTSLSSTKI